MELLSILILVALILLIFKVLGWIFKAGFLILSIPLKIAAAVLLALLISVFLPLTIIGGILSLFVVGVLVPFVPLFLIGFGVYLLARR
jgi:hypothetical protein